MPTNNTCSLFLDKLCIGQDLSADEMALMTHHILSGDWTPAQIAGILIALRAKGESPNEIAAAAAVMREMMVGVDVDREITVDTCGTGGDGVGTFNVSTTVAFVVAACGVPVAKHGNRAVSSVSGGSDVLEALGMRLDLSANEVSKIIKEIGIGFMFAPNHHAVMRHVVPVRRELGVRTIFSLLGPLTNPARVSRQVLGVFSRDWVLPYAETLTRLGIRCAMVVYGDGLDEITIAGVSDIAKVDNGAIIRQTIAPEDVGLSRAPLESITVDGVNQSKQMLLDVLKGKTGPARDIVLLNAAAVLIVAGWAKDFVDGVGLAKDAIDKGQAHLKLEAFIEATH